MKTVLTIAGSDSSGGAGIQADIKTIAAHGLYATSAITALTAQNTLGVTAIQETTPDFLAAQLDAVFTDIPPDAVKIGMVANAALIAVIAEKLAQYKPAAIVADPVMVSTSGSALLAPDARETLIHTLLPSASLITPNIPEAEVIWGQSIPDEKAMEAAARAITRQLKGPAVLIKGGHRVSDATDLLCTQGTCTWFSAERIATENTHGTGCTLSSAIACQLALGEDLPTSIKRAKDYLTGALRAGLNLGQGSGPLDHGWQTAY
ncbi:MAG: bifunctional hydroxymethylpyrimidine kinase/phosphomethylpyrimidine kinase [Eubacterium aggregans]|uniref:bifunctional hydroxymethylpyrimidine kinase/phosphomethylpyrimidine kinase n=1 Tax=Eubacterium aggregans TaxID=81409 RepID=UPI002B1F6FB6|nr:bifunctional hydroxymethylpyrimidine kinase/phosphomethylpyrimidine kinase [Eubacterium aggregans]MEA5073054.1 bifunctional hydroxymethylpyrimidine kinase/phosphomethylpyrimidine kinase [Eubacterium aggregans]